MGQRRRDRRFFRTISLVLVLVRALTHALAQVRYGGGGGRGGEGDQECDHCGCEGVVRGFGSS